MQRIGNIDLLRAVAILGVVAYHFTTRFPAQFYHAAKMPAFLPIGQFGVDLFFVVSGYCVCMLMARPGHAFAGFCLNRMIRLQPAYMASAVLTFAIVTAFGLEGREVGLRTLLSNLVWTQAAVGGPLVDGVYWSLLVELKFYFLLALLRATWRGNLALPWALFSSVGMLLYLLPETHAAARYLLIAPYSASFLAGILAFEAQSHPRRQRLGLAAATLFLLAISPRFAEFPFAGVALTVAACVVLTAPAFHIPRWTAYFAAISYSLYLLHDNIGLVVIRELAPVVPDVGVRIAMAFATVVTLSVLMRELVERRCGQALTGALPPRGRQREAVT